MKFVELDEDEVDPAVRCIECKVLTARHVWGPCDNCENRFWAPDGSDSKKSWAPRRHTHAGLRLNLGSETPWQGVSKYMLGIRAGF